MSKIIVIPFVFLGLLLKLLFSRLSNTMLRIRDLPEA